MDELIRAALANLARPSWRLLWRDYREFGLPPGYFIECDIYNEPLDDATASALLTGAYVSQVDADPLTDAWKRDYEITENGRAALTA